MAKTYTLGKDAYKRKKFPTVPGGKYQLKVTSKTELVKDEALKIHAQVIKDGKGKKVKKGVTLFDHIAFHVDWKVAQLLLGLGKKLTKFTPEQLLKLVKGKVLWAILREEEYNGKNQNKVVQYLPPREAGESDDDDTDADDEDEEEQDDDEQDEDDDEEEDSDDDDGEESDDDDEEEQEDDDDSDDDDDDDDDADDEEEEDDDDEEEDKPKSKSKKSAAKKTTKQKKK